MKKSIKALAVAVVAGVGFWAQATVATAAGAIIFLPLNEAKTLYFAEFNKPSEKVALSAAREKCTAYAKKIKATQKCQGPFTHAGPGWWAVFFSENGDAGTAVDVNSRQGAIDRAYKECVEVAGKIGCPNTTSNDNIWYDEGPKKVANAAPAGQKCSPPAGKVLRYSDSCSNGDCMRTFENGCKVRFQAPYCYDAFQQKWSWKPDGC